METVALVEAKGVQDMQQAGVSMNTPSGQHAPRDIEGLGLTWRRVLMAVMRLL
jgi:hypothetical protein